jgi:glycine cleavage system H protein
MDLPSDLRYSRDHEWARVGDDGRVTVGITAFAQDALGDVVFVQVPEVGAEVGSGDALAEVESTKSVSDVYAPLAGTVVAVNDQLADTPELLNQDPYGAGWIFVMEPADPAALESLLDAEAYQALIEA